jgi:branched-chain amino acid transport system substrate-binding protein
MDNPANKKFVAEFQKAYNRLPTGYASTGYDTALLIDSAVRKVKGRIEDKDALRAALKAADFRSVRGDFKFGPNQFPIQDYYLQLVGKGADGRIVHKTIGTVLNDRADAYAQDCKMK